MYMMLLMNAECLRRITCNVLLNKKLVFDNEI